jgi:tight adherence protein B
VEKYYKKLLAEKRRKQLALEFKDMLLSLSASFQTGRQMTEAILEARGNLLLICPKDAPINLELEQMARRLTSGGESEREVLFDFANRSRNEDVRNFADVYYTCLTTGGDIVKVVNRTAEVLVEKITIRREIETLTAQKKYEAKILTAMPLLIIVFLRLNSPTYLTPLYTTAAGVLVMAGALLALGASFVWSNRIMDIEV